MRKIQELATDSSKIEEINNLVVQLEQVCLQACDELEEEFNKIKKNI